MKKVSLLTLLFLSSTLIGCGQLKGYIRNQILGETVPGGEISQDVVDSLEGNSIVNKLEEEYNVIVPGEVVGIIDSVEDVADDVTLDVYKESSNLIEELEERGLDTTGAESSKKMIEDVIIGKEKINWLNPKSLYKLLLKSNGLTDEQAEEYMEEMGIK